MTCLMSQQMWVQEAMMLDESTDMGEGIWAQSGQCDHCTA